MCHHVCKTLRSHFLSSCWDKILTWLMISKPIFEALCNTRRTINKDHTDISLIPTYYHTTHVSLLKIPPTQLERKDTTIWMDELQLGVLVASKSTMKKWFRNLVGEWCRNESLLFHFILFPSDGGLSLDRPWDPNDDDFNVFPGVLVAQTRSVLILGERWCQQAVKNFIRLAFPSSLLHWWVQGR